VQTPLILELRAELGKNEEAGKILGPLIGKVKAKQSSLHSMEVINWVKVFDGYIAIGHRPSKKLISDLKIQGAGHILTLLSETEGAREIENVARRNKLNWLWFPIENRQPPDSGKIPELRELFQKMAYALRIQERIYIHCSAGIHRTGMISYAFLRFLGIPREVAKDKLRKLRYETWQGVGDERLTWGMSLPMTLPLHFCKGTCLSRQPVHGGSRHGCANEFRLFVSTFHRGGAVPAWQQLSWPHERLAFAVCRGRVRRSPWCRCLGRFDLLLDAPHGTVAISAVELKYGGHSVPLDEFMGIPIVSARIRGTDYRMFFDTGAQVSYFQDKSLTHFPSAGAITDFYPGFGRFQTETHKVPVTLGPTEFTLRCGRLPGLLGTTLIMAGTEGIIGNQILTDRPVGYFPRRRSLVL